MKINSRSSTIVQTVLMDVDFDRTIYDLMENGIVKNLAAKQHVAEIERTILTVKDSTR